MININPELKSLIPPLSVEEYEQLEQNCIAEGIRDSLVVAVYPNEDAEEIECLCDGHNRYEIAQNNDLEFTTVRHEFESFDAVKIWMIDNQKGRRNLNDFVKYELAQVKAEILRIKGRDKMVESKKGNQNASKTSLSIIDKDELPTHNTREEIAKELGWSTGKVAMADVVNKEADEETKDKLRRNEISINRAYQEIRKPSESSDDALEPNQGMAIHYSSESPEWYTPKEFIHRVERVLGVIDLDPCSNSKEKPNVPAINHFTKEDDGLSKQWNGSVYMNPPYGRPISDWSEKLNSEFELGRVTEFIALVPARTDTNWFLKFKDCVYCFIKGRLKFSDHKDAAPFPNVAIYRGENKHTFKKTFDDYGLILKKYE